MFELYKMQDFVSVNRMNHWNPKPAGKAERSISKGRRPKSSKYIEISGKRPKGSITRKLEKNSLFLDISLAGRNNDTFKSTKTNLIPHDDLRSKESANLSAPVKETETASKVERTFGQSTDKQTLSRKWQANLSFLGVKVHKHEEQKQKRKVVPPPLSKKLEQNLQFLNIDPSSKPSADLQSFGLNDRALLRSRNAVRLKKEASVLPLSDLKEIENGQFSKGHNDKETTGSMEQSQRSFSTQRDRLKHVGSRECSRAYEHPTMGRECAYYETKLVPDTKELEYGQFSKGQNHTEASGSVEQPEMSFSTQGDCLQHVEHREFTGTYEHTTLGRECVHNENRFVSGMKDLDSWQFSKGYNHTEASGNTKQPQMSFSTQKDHLRHVGSGKFISAYEHPSIGKECVYNENNDTSADTSANEFKFINKNRDTSGFTTKSDSKANQSSDFQYDYQPNGKHSNSDHRTNGSTRNVKRTMNMSYDRLPVDVDKTILPSLRQKLADVIRNRTLKDSENITNESDSQRGTDDYVLSESEYINIMNTQDVTACTINKKLNDIMDANTIVATPKEKGQIQTSEGDKDDDFKTKQNKRVKMLERDHSLTKIGTRSRYRSHKREYIKRQRQYCKPSFRQALNSEGYNHKGHYKVKYNTKQRELGTVFRKARQPDKMRLQRTKIDKTLLHDIESKTVKHAFDAMWLVQDDQVQLLQSDHGDVSNEPFDAAIQNVAESMVLNSKTVMDRNNNYVNLGQAEVCVGKIDANSDGSDTEPKIVKGSIQTGTESCEDKPFLNNIHEFVPDNLFQQRDCSMLNEMENCLKRKTDADITQTNKEKAILIASETASGYLRESLTATGDSMFYFPFTLAELEEESLWVTTHALLRSLGASSLVYSRLLAISQKTSIDASVILRMFLDLLYKRMYGNAAECPPHILNTICEIARQMKFREADLKDMNMIQCGSM